MRGERDVVFGFFYNRGRKILAFGRTPLNLFYLI